MTDIHLWDWSSERAYVQVMVRKIQCLLWRPRVVMSSNQEKAWNNSWIIFFDLNAVKGSLKSVGCFFFGIPREWEGAVGRANR